jgi:glycosyltransferase involved in cell wall biosynthesis
MFSTWAMAKVARAALAPIPLTPGVSRLESDEVTGRMKAGVVMSHPIQYFSPLYDLIESRAVVDLSVAYGNDAGQRSVWDPGFGGRHKWDIDLVGGHRHEFLTRSADPSRLERARAYRRLAELIRGWDVVVINGYATGLTAAAIAVCRITSVPYLLRIDTSTRINHPIISPRHWWPRRASQWSAGGLSVGQKNSAIHRSLGSPSVFSAPFAIDVDRFQTTATRVRMDRNKFRESLGLPQDIQIVAFAGKFIDMKRPGDLISLAVHLRGSAHILMIGDGPEMRDLQAAAEGLPVTFTGFLNQSEMPEALACSDVIVLPSSYEPWGLIVNEAMACGCVPVVSDQVGCAPDLVAGIGEVYSVGDMDALATAVRRALRTARAANSPDRLTRRLGGFTLEVCAAGYEAAFLKVGGAALL